jgi:hypothetical protein
MSDSSLRAALAAIEFSMDDVRTTLEREYARSQEGGELLYVREQLFPDVELSMVERDWIRIARWHEQAAAHIAHILPQLLSGIPPMPTLEIDAGFLE